MNDKRVERPFNRDRFINLGSRLGGRAAMEVVNTLQHHTPEAQVVGLCAAFLLLCDHIKVPAQDAFTITKNMLNNTERSPGFGEGGVTGSVEFDAVRAYLKGEVVSDRAV